MIDGRLAVPAATAWATAVAVTVLVQQSALPTERHRLALIAAGASIALTIALVIAVACARGRSPRGRVRLLVAACIALGALSTSVQLAALTGDPVGGWVERRVTATLTGVVTSDPVTRTRGAAAIWQSARTVEIRMATSSASARGALLAVEVPIIVRLPPDGPMPDPGSVIAVSGRLTASRHPEVAGLLVAAAPPRVLQPPGLLDATANAMRAGLRAAVSGTPPDAAALVTGLSVGDESLQSTSLDVAMRTSGLSHLTAVSGGNVAIVLVAVLAIARLLRIRLRARIPIALLALLCFVILVRPQPSVVRAAVMGVVMVAALAAGGRRTGPSVLAAAVLALVIVAPLLTVTWAFALSVFATAGLILIAPVLVERLRGWRRTARLPPALAEALAITMAAQIATAPLLITMGAAVGWAAIPANLLAMPAVAPVTVLGLVAAALAPIAPGVASLIGHVAAWPAGWIALVAHACSDLPLATLPWPTGIPGLLALVVAGVAGWVIRRRLRHRFPGGPPRPVLAAIAGTVALTLAVLVLAPPRLRGWPPPGWQLIACDVGQGDALVARTGPDSALVIDAGPDPGSIRRCLDDLRIASVSAVILTHFHADHVNGLPGILDRFPVGAVFTTPVGDPADEVSLVDGWLREHGITPTVARVGDVLRAGDATWRVLWPRRVITRGSIPNNASVVIAMEIGGTSFLLPGDVEAEAQTALIAQEPGLHVDVVKVPHHGSRNQDPRLPGWSRARIALISCGAGNRYGHPNPGTVSAWEGAGALLGRTDTDGDLAVVRAPDGRLGLVPRGSA